jgi:hypothetical protein
MTVNFDALLEPGLPLARSRRHSWQSSHSSGSSLWEDDDDLLPLSDLSLNEDHAKATIRQRKASAWRVDGLPKGSLSLALDLASFVSDSYVSVIHSHGTARSTRMTLPRPFQAQSSPDHFQSLTRLPLHWSSFKSLRATMQRKTRKTQTGRPFERSEKASFPRLMPRLILLRQNQTRHLRNLEVKRCRSCRWPSAIRTRILS